VPVPIFRPHPTTLKPPAGVNLGVLSGHPTIVNSHAFTPFQPPPIPAGYYDPALDAQRGAASRGLTNTEQDIGLAGRRAGEDYGLDPNDPTYGYSTVGQINLGYGRDTADLSTQRTYEGQDYDRNVQLLTRQYAQQGRQQAEQARKYGVTSGGIALLSAAKRNENQAIDRQGIDTAHTRAVAGFDTTGQRLTEDHTNALGKAGSDYNRGVADRGTALGRAQSEDTFYGVDVGNEKNYQATQAGYQAPTGPANERVLPDGRHVQDVRQNGYLITYDQHGNVVSRKKVGPTTVTSTVNLTHGRP
jgi:hypothetical protein